MKLREIRKQRGLTQVKLAKKLKVSQAYVAQLETGEQDNPTLDTLKRLAKVLKTTEVALMGMEAGMVMPAGAMFKWMLWPPNGQHSIVSDEFIADGFRVRITGDLLEVTCEIPGGCPPESARALAERYVEALGKHLIQRPTLMTQEDWGKRTSAPFSQSTTISTTRADRTRATTAAREARNELLASGDETLRLCYDHLKIARENETESNNQAAVSVYKAMEELKKRLGKKTTALLGKQFELVKRAANEQRHIEGNFQPMKNPPASLVADAERVIRTYERYLLQNRRTP